jgi:hypothetical protein
MSAAEYADVPPAIVDRVRSLCAGFPETIEREAWSGRQWRIRDRTFAHVITVDFADGPVTALTFRAAGPELDALRGAGDPFFRPAWGADAVGLVLDAGVDWDEVGELLTESYRAVAPKRLAQRLDRAPG